MKIGKLIVAAAVIGGVVAGVSAALKTPQGKAAADKVVGKAKESVSKVKEKFVKKQPGEVVAEATCEEACVEEAVELYEDELPDIDPVAIPVEEVEVDEEV